VIRRIVLLLLLFLPQLCFAAQIQGRVVGVCDGDTITVLNNGHTDRVRLNGIDCPEKGQDFGARAKQLTSDLCYGF
jgi:endonuclease YncB( thermonuclease family)